MIEVKPPNYKGENGVFLVRCTQCNKENYALAVASGICAWCGVDANRENEQEKEFSNAKKR
jgi:ssDNA-binding Zn-finger/Zn-ribbon topoisomerase 1